VDPWGFQPKQSTAERFHQEASYLGWSPRRTFRAGLVSPGCGSEFLDEVLRFDANRPSMSRWRVASFPAKLKGAGGRAAWGLALVLQAVLACFFVATLMQARLVSVCRFRLLLRGRNFEFGFAVSVRRDAGCARFCAGTSRASVSRLWSFFHGVKWACSMLLGSNWEALRDFWWFAQFAAR